MTLPTIYPISMRLMILLIMSLALGCYVDLAPKRVLLQKMIYEETHLMQESNTVNAMLRQEPNIRHRHEQLQQALNGLFQPANKNAVTTDILSMILASAENHGLMLESLHPENDSINTFFNTLHFKSTASGTFLQFMAFMEELSNYSLPITLTDFTVSKKTDTLLQIDMSLAAFCIFTSDFQVNKKQRGLLSQPSFDVHLQHDPFIPFASTTYSPMESLHVDFQKIKFVGYIFDGDQRLGLALLPNKKTIAIALGDQLGREKAKVMRIDEQGIWVTFMGRTHQCHYWLGERYAL